MMLLIVNVISDVICPWCYIGKRRLEKAINGIDEQQEVRVSWLPFQLNPTMPKEGISRREYRTRKFGSWERSQELDGRVVAVGEAEGIQFVFDKSEKTPNTFDAHRLIWLADQESAQEAIVEGLFRAYFTEGRDIGNHQTLLDVAAESGIDRHKADRLLNSEQGSEAVKAEEEKAHRLGVQGVPFFVINEKITLSGAQPPDAFLAAFKQILGRETT